MARIYHFPIDFCMGLTTEQRYCAACDIGYTTFFDKVKGIYGTSKIQ